MIRPALAAALLAIVCACSSAPPPQAAAPPPLDAPAAVCTSGGGAMTKVCRRGVERCVTPFRDAGKRCSDGDQCQGDCLFNGPEAKPGEPLVGACQRNNDPCGCFTPLEDGQISDRSRCVD